MADSASFDTLASPQNHEMPLNAYGDYHRAAGSFGIDVASQRLDDLDRMAVAEVEKRLIHDGLCRALDLACGEAALAGRFAQMGAHALAIDIRIPVCIPAGVQFLRADLRQLPEMPPLDVVVCQRAIHYLTYPDAVGGLVRLREAVRADARLYLSASGIASELGQDYADRDVPLAFRYAPLSEGMAAKHNIRGQVCLYSESDLCSLLRASRWRVEEIFTSAFGNVKSVATPQN